MKEKCTRCGREISVDESQFFSISEIVCVDCAELDEEFCQILHKDEIRAEEAALAALGEEAALISEMTD